jgi:hypothetical protein
LISKVLLLFIYCYLMGTRSGKVALRFYMSRGSTLKMPVRTSRPFDRLYSILYCTQCAILFICTHTKKTESTMNIYSSVFIASLFFTNTDASVLRGKVDTKARGLMPLENAPTCEEINSVFPKFSCTEECSTTYWQCVNGDVIASEMPSGSNCINGGFAEFGQCNQSER